MARSGTNPTAITTTGSTTITGEVEVKNDTGSPVPVSSTTLATEETLGRRFGEQGRTTQAFNPSTSGNNTIITPASGMRLRVFWVGLSVASADEVIAIVKFGVAGTSKYRWNLGAFMHWETLEGATDEPLVVNLSAAVSTNVNVTYEEF